jgi:hypothetical protein
VRDTRLIGFGFVQIGAAIPQEPTPLTLRIFNIKLILGSTPSRDIKQAINFRRRVNFRVFAAECNILKAAVCSNSPSVEVTSGGDDDK